MLTAEILVPIVIEIVTGAACGVFIGNIVPPVSLGLWRNAGIGAIGGLALTWLAARIPGVEQFVEAVDEMGTPVEALSPDLLVGVGVAGLLGGALLVTIVGLLRNRART